MFTTSAGNFVKQSVVYAQDTAPAGTTVDVFKTVPATVTIVDGDIWLDLDATGGQILVNRYDSIGNGFDQIATDPSVATGGYVMEVKVTERVGAPLNGTLWFDPDVNELAIYEVVSDSGTQNGKESRRTICYN